jgi:hypothetical protein
MRQDRGRQSRTREGWKSVGFYDYVSITLYLHKASEVMQRYEAKHKTKNEKFFRLPKKEVLTRYLVLESERCLPLLLYEECRGVLVLRGGGAGEGGRGAQRGVLRVCE